MCLFNRETAFDTDDDEQFDRSEGGLISPEKNPSHEAAREFTMQFTTTGGTELHFFRVDRSCIQKMS